MRLVVVVPELARSLVKLLAAAAVVLAGIGRHCWLAAAAIGGLLAAAENCCRSLLFACCWTRIGLSVVPLITAGAAAGSARPASGGATRGGDAARVEVEVEAGGAEVVDLVSSMVAGKVGAK